MKYIWILIAVVAIAVLVVRFSRDRGVDVPPITDTTLAGPQEPVPVKEEQKSLPTQNKVIIKNNMKIETTKEGTGPEIKTGQTAVVTYVGKFTNGTVFDASKNHGDGSFSFTLGAGQVIKGWDQGVLGMKVGEARTLTVPPELGYGSTDYGPIPGNSTLIFDVELLAIK